MIKHLALPIILSVSSVVSATGSLENPALNSIESGIGAISGWHCNANEIEVVIDGKSKGNAGSGTRRKDTEEICGHPNTGFSLLFNYNVLPPGDHTIAVYADGLLLSERAFKTTRSGGEEFLQNTNKSVTVDNFPTTGTSSSLEWNQSKQSFVVTGQDNESDSIIGEYELNRILFSLDSDVLDTDNENLSASGTVSITSTRMIFNITLTMNNQSVVINNENIRYDDFGSYIVDREDDTIILLSERGNVLTMVLSFYDEDGLSQQMYFWTKKS